MPSTKTSKTTYDTGPWKAMTGPIENEALPALRAGYDRSTTGAGGQMLDTATGLANETMAGKYLDLANNPYLTNAMDAASRSTQTYYDALGARSGRGSRGSDFSGEMARGTESARLAPLLGLYESERGRQQQTMGMAPGLNMAGMAPSMALADAYRGFGALGKSGSDTTKSSEFNPMGIAGAVLGAMVNPMGTMAGAGLGMLNGGVPGFGSTSGFGMAGTPFSSTYGPPAPWAPGSLAWN
jgi:hypothetical protein